MTSGPFRSISAFLSQGNGSPGVNDGLIHSIPFMPEALWINSKAVRGKCALAPYMTGSYGLHFNPFFNPINGSCGPQFA
jgi:hypothetical protein